MAAGIAIVGVAETPPLRRSDRNIRAMVTEAVLGALDDAGISPREVDGLVTDSLIMPPDVPSDWLAGQLGASNRFAGAASLGGAGIMCGPMLAEQAIASGRAKVVVGYFGVDWGSRAGGPYAFHDLYPAKHVFEKPYGFNAQPIYFGLWARRYMHEYGLTERQLGSLVIAHRQHAILNGRSQLERPLTYEEYLASRMIADPLRAADCCLITDGAGAFVMTSQDRARDCRKRPVRVLGTGFASAPVTGDAAFTQDSPLTVIPGAAQAARQAFALARISPKEVDFAEIYDCFSISCLLQIEDMGLCPKGEAGAFIEDGNIAPGGALPVNTHGGFLAHSYRLGIEHVIEAVRQLRHEAGAAQVPDAEIGLVSGLSMPDFGVLLLGR
jgi:acetyl-CoA acetyltransferase